MKKTNQKGFSLVELLVVVIIIAIIAAIAIPNLLASRRAANEASAIQALRTIHSAQATFFATTGANTNYGTLAQLGTATLIDSVLAAGAKGGYGYAVDNSTAGHFCASATATSGAGDRSFAVSAPGVIYGIAGTTAPTCNAATDAITTGSPIQ